VDRIVCENRQEHFGEILLISDMAPEVDGPHPVADNEVVRFCVYANHSLAIYDLFLPPGYIVLIDRVSLHSDVKPPGRVQS
jgi:hypothetical protein